MSPGVLLLGNPQGHCFSSLPEALGKPVNDLPCLCRRRGQVLLAPPPATPSAGPSPCRCAPRPPAPARRTPLRTPSRGSGETFRRRLRRVSGGGVPWLSLRSASLRGKWDPAVCWAGGVHQSHRAARPAWPSARLVWKLLRRVTVASPSSVPSASLARLHFLGVCAH